MSACGPFIWNTDLAEEDKGIKHALRVWFPSVLVAIIEGYRGTRTIRVVTHYAKPIVPRRTKFELYGPTSYSLEEAKHCNTDLIRSPLVSFGGVLTRIQTFPPFLTQLCLAVEWEGKENPVRLVHPHTHISPPGRCCFDFYLAGKYLFMWHRTRAEAFVCNLEPSYRSSVEPTRWNPVVHPDVLHCVLQRALTQTSIYDYHNRLWFLAMCRTSSATGNVTVAFATCAKMVNQVICALPAPLPFRLFGPWKSAPLLQVMDVENGVIYLMGGCPTLLVNAVIYKYHVDIPRLGWMETGFILPACVLLRLGSPTYCHPGTLPCWAFLVRNRYLVIMYNSEQGVCLNLRGDPAKTKWTDVSFPSPLQFSNNRIFGALEADVHPSPEKFSCERIFGVLEHVT